MNRSPRFRWVRGQKSVPFVMCPMKECWMESRIPLPPWRTDHNLILCLLKVPNLPLHAPRDAKSMMRKGEKKVQRVRQNVLWWIMPYVSQYSKSRGIPDLPYSPRGRATIRRAASKELPHRTLGDQSTSIPGRLRRELWGGKHTKRLKKRGMFPPTTEDHDQIVAQDTRRKLTPMPRHICDIHGRTKRFSESMYREHLHCNKERGMFPPTTGNRSQKRNEWTDREKTYPHSPLYQENIFVRSRKVNKQKEGDHIHGKTREEIPTNH